MQFIDSCVFQKFIYSPKIKSTENIHTCQSLPYAKVLKMPAIYYSAKLNQPNSNHELGKPRSTTQYFSLK